METICGKNGMELGAGWGESRKLFKELLPDGIIDAVLFRKRRVYFLHVHALGSNR